MSFATFVILTVIVVVVILIIGAGMPRGGGEAGAQVQCRHCGSAQPRHARFCRKCGKQIV